MRRPLFGARPVAWPKSACPGRLKGFGRPSYRPQIQPQLGLLSPRNRRFRFRLTPHASGARKEACGLLRWHALAILAARRCGLQGEQAVQDGQSASNARSVQSRTVPVDLAGPCAPGQRSRSHKTARSEPGPVPLCGGSPDACTPQSTSASQASHASHATMWLAFS